MNKTIYILVFCFFLSAFLLTLKGYPLFVDEELMYLSAVNWVEEGIPFTKYHPQITQIGRYGLPYSNFGLGQSIYEIPFYMTARLFVPRTGVQSGFLLTSAVYPSAPLLMALAMTIVFRLSLLLRFSVRRAWWNTLLTGFTTLCWPYSKMLFRDPLQMVCLLLAVTLLVRNRAGTSTISVFLSGTALGYGVLTKETMLLYVPFLLGYLCSGRKQGRTGRVLVFLLPVLLSGLICLGYNYYRFGDIFDFCYTADNRAHGMSTPFAEGFYGLLFSTGRGFFVFNPVMVMACAGLVPFYRRNRAELLLFGSLFGATVLFYSKFWTWGGSWAWGPRFLLVATPYMALIATEGLARWMVAGIKKTFALILIGISFAVQIPGVTMHAAPYLSMIAHDVHLFPLTSEKTIDIRNDLIHVDFIPQFSPIWGLSWSFKHALSLPFRDRADIRESMKRDCPWRTISPAWVPDFPDKALGAGPDFLAVTWSLNMPGSRRVIYGLYLINLIACCSFYFAIRKNLRRIEA
ncbi:hypothetical protein JXA40_05825 [bacterium]|nr:hypothetical protein [candidate division CSSED10-310 bacterium]